MHLEKAAIRNSHPDPGLPKQEDQIKTPLETELTGAENQDECSGNFTRIESG